MSTIRKKHALLLAYFGLPAAAAAGYLSADSGILSDPLYAISFTSGILAYTWIMFQFILSSRHPAVENGVGLDKLMKLHRIMGAVIVVLLIPHVLVRIALFPSSLQTFLGLLAFAGFIGVGIFSSIFFTSPRPGLSYEKVKLMHNGTFLLSLLVAVHIALSSAAGGISFLSVYFSIVGILGIGAYLYRKIAAPRKSRAYPWAVASVEEIADEHVELLLRPQPGVRLSHLWHQRLPGQFAFLRFLGKGSREEHPFTISSCGPADSLRFTVKKVGDFTSRLSDVSPGDSVAVEGPFGVFSYRALPDAAETPLVAIAGGIGITPFLAMFEALGEEVAEKRPPRAFLYWAASRPEYFVHKDFFENLEEEWENFSFLTSTGKVDSEWLYGEVKRRAGERANYFLCGPPGLTASISLLLRKKGVDKRRIITERFGL